MLALRPVRGRVACVAALVVASAALLALAACSVGSRATATPPGTVATATPAASATPASTAIASPTAAAPPAGATPAARPTPAIRFQGERRTGVAPIDRVIDDVLTSNLQALAAFTAPHPVACGGEAQVGAPTVACPPGTTAGDTVAAFTTAGCTVSLVSADAAAGAISQTLSRLERIHLYAVVQRHPLPGDDWGGAPYLVVFGYVDGEARAFAVADDGITGVRQGCPGADSLTDMLGSDAQYLLPPPDQGPPLVDVRGLSAPRGTESGDATVDAAIRAVLTTDAQGLAALMQTQRVACLEGGGGPGRLPPCPTGTASGTLIPVFPVSACEGGWATDLLAEATTIVGHGLRLHSVVRLSSPDAYDVVFTRPVATPGLSGVDEEVLTLEANHVVRFALGCGPAPSPLRVLSYPADRSPVMILRGPAFPD